MRPHRSTTVSRIRLVARNRSKLIAGLSVLGLMGTAACPAYAQDAGDATRASAGSDIVVTARKREENPINVQVALSAFSSEQITRLGATGLRDVAAMAPGLTLDRKRGGSGKVGKERVRLG